MDGSPAASGGHGRPQRRRPLIMKPFQGMMNDVRRRLPYYKSDIVDGFTHPRMIPGIVQTYFVNLIPAMAYTLDMHRHTHGSYGVNEVLLGTFMAAFIFGFFSCQPLTIVGITGLIDLYTYTTYRIVTGHYGVPFLPFMAWVGIWSCAMHWIIAIFNLVSYTREITQFSVDTFGFYVGVVYIQYGVRTLVYELEVSREAMYCSIALAVLFYAVAQSISVFSRSVYTHRYLRLLAADYVLPACVLLFTGFTYIPGPLKETNLDTLPISRSWFPTLDRPWFVPFWHLETRWIWVAIPFAFLMTVLFYYDHNVSSLAAQSTEFPLRKPSGFHWDFFLLGLVTLLAGFLGIPPPNGLVPQAPLHTNALAVRREHAHDPSPTGDEAGAKEGSDSGESTVAYVVEQRVSNLAQGFLVLGTMTRPLLVVLGLIRRGVLAGVFVFVGWGAIEGNGITKKLLFLLRQRSLDRQLDSEPLARVRRRSIYIFVGCQLFGFAITIAISQTVAAIGFSVLIFALIPVRTYVIPLMIPQDELAVLDAPAASEFTLESVTDVHSKKSM